MKRPKAEVGQRVKAPQGHPYAGRIGRIVRVYQSNGKTMATVVWPQQDPQ